MGFIKSIFKPKIAAVPTANTVTGRDLLPATSSEEPEAALMGDSYKKKKQAGVRQLLIPSESLIKGGK